MGNLQEAKAIAKAKRKEVAKVRIFWLLFVLDIVLVGYVIIQVLLLLGVK